MDSTPDISVCCVNERSVNLLLCGTDLNGGAAPRAKRYQCNHSHHHGHPHAALHKSRSVRCGPNSQWRGITKRQHKPHTITIKCTIAASCEGLLRAALLTLCIASSLHTGRARLPWVRREHGDHYRIGDCPVLRLPVRGHAGPWSTCALVIASLPRGTALLASGTDRFQLCIATRHTSDS